MARSKKYEACFENRRRGIVFPQPANGRRPERGMPNDQYALTFLW